MVQSILLRMQKITMEAMLKMKKISIAELEHAADGR